jgi:hypothetical protein
MQIRLQVGVALKIFYETLEILLVAKTPAELKGQLTAFNITLARCTMHKWGLQKRIVCKMFIALPAWKKVLKLSLHFFSFHSTYCNYTCRSK